MTRLLSIPLILIASYAYCAANPDKTRAEAEYYVSAYARLYHVPLALVRSIVQQESGWKPCSVSSKGAVGLMQLMPQTARWLGVADRCNIRQNIWGGVRYLAWLMQRFRGDLRLVAAAYYTGEYVIGEKGTQLQESGRRCLRESGSRDLRRPAQPSTSARTIRG